MVEHWLAVMTMDGQADGTRCLSGWTINEVELVGWLSGDLGTV